MDVPQIDGLELIENFITEKEEKIIMEFIDAQEWNTTLKRRTQHYGYLYEYKSKDIKKTRPLEDVILKVANRIQKREIMKPEQCIVNEYLNGQGISPHIDSLNFGPIICSLSLLEDENMIFERDEKKECILLPRRSLLVLKNDARYLYKHSLRAKRKEGYRRISMTYRTIKT